MAKVKLHRCSYTFLHHDMDACWRMKKALDEAGVEYEVVKHGFTRTQGARKEIIEKTGQKYLPVLELADGTAYREETNEMIAKLKAGTLPGPTS